MKTIGTYVCFISFILMCSFFSQVSLCQKTLIKQILNLPRNGCIPLKVAPSLSLDSSVKIKSYKWNFGDGSTSADDKPTHIYTKEGIYAIEVNIEAENGNSETFRLDSAVAAGHKPKASFTPFFDTICPHEKIKFTSTSSNALITHLQWNFEAVQVYDSGKIYFYDPRDTGYLHITLIAFNYGCSDTLSRKALYSIPPYASFFVTQNCTNKKLVNFRDRSILDVEHTYDFGDGIIDTTKSPNHLYKSPGNYLVQLFTHNNTCRDTASHFIHVIDEEGVIALPKNTFCMKSNVTANILGVDSSYIAEAQWNFGDGINKTTNYSVSATHVYTDTGNFLISASVNDLNGCKYNYNADTVHINHLPDFKILAANNGCVNASIGFKCLSLNNDSLKWQWNFNNGLSANENNSNTVFNAGGKFTVALTATNQLNCSDSVHHNIFISAPKINGGNDTSICQNSVARLHATGGISYLWSGDNLSCTNCQSPTIKLDSEKIYQVTGTDKYGCKANNSIIVSIIQPVKIKINNAYILCVGSNKELKAAGADSYNWSPSMFLDNPQNANPVFSAVTDTSINYKVIGFSEKKCFSDTAFTHVKTFPIPQLKINENKVELSVGSSVQLKSNGSKDITNWQWQPVIGLNSAFVANPVASPKQTTTYSVIASNGGGCVARDEITINVICKNSNVYIPNAFSPNSDGMNDVFYPRGTGLFNVKSFLIFNRWGQPVFAKYNIPPNNASYGWNGNYNGTRLSADVYMYVIEVVCENGFVMPVKGTITLMN